MKKTTMVVLLLLIMLLTMPAYSQTGASDARMQVVIDQELQDYELLLSQGRIMVPMRAVFERLGAEVNWYPQTRTVAAQKDQVLIILTVDQQTAVVAGQAVRLDAPAMLDGGRTFVPLRFVAESLGAAVRWDPDARTAFIQTAGSGQSLQSGLPETEALQMAQPVPQADLSALQYQKELRGLTIGMSRQEAETILGGAQANYTAPAGNQWSSYHNQYKDYYLLSYKNGRVHFIYTSNSKDSFAGYSPGDSPAGLSAEVTYDSGRYRATFSASQDKRLIVKDGLVGIFYLDQHDANKIAAIRVITPQSLLSDTIILAYRITFTQRGDVPEMVPFSSAAQISVVENAQSAIHFELDNTARVNHNLPLFRWNQSVAEVARQHSLDMAVNQYFNHTSLRGLSPFDRIRNAGISYQMAAENISWGERYYDAIESHHGLMNSLGHRKNIVNSDLTDLGIGSSYQGGLYFTQKFIR